MSQKNIENSLRGKKSPNQQKLQKEKSDKKTFPLMTEEIPLVSGAVPLVSREIPLVSGLVPLVSSRPPITLLRYWGLLPSRRWGKTGLPKGRKRELRPTDIGLFKFLGKVITVPRQPGVMFKGPAERIKEITKENK